LNAASRRNIRVTADRERETERKSYLRAQVDQQQMIACPVAHQLVTSPLELRRYKSTIFKPKIRRKMTRTQEHQQPRKASPTKLNHQAGKHEKKTKIEQEVPPCTLPARSAARVPDIP
jgi:hypothetical protein